MPSDVTLSPTQRGHSTVATLDECQPSPQPTARVGETSGPDLWDDDFRGRIERAIALLQGENIVLRARVANLEERTAPIEEQVRLVVERSVKALGSRIVRICHSFSQDHSGDEAIFFRVVLPDNLCRRDYLHSATQDVEDAVRTEIARFNDFERFAYFNYRSESETKVHVSPEWE